MGEESEITNTVLVKHFKGLFLRNLSNHRRVLFFPISRRIVDFTFAQDVIDGSDILQAMEIMAY